jgi:hypothetical protein
MDNISLGEYVMDMNRMRELAGMETITEAAKAPAEKQKYVATYDGKSIDVMATDESDAKKKAVDSASGLSVPMTQWGKVVIKLAESVVVEAEDKAPELDTKAETAVKKVKVPADVTTAINTRISELKQSIAQDDDKGYNDGGVRSYAIDALEQIAANLKLDDGLTVANIFYGTLNSPVTSLLPPKVVKFLHAAPMTVKEAVTSKALVVDAYTDADGLDEAYGFDGNGDQTDASGGAYSIAAVETLKKGEYVKRKPDANKVYMLGDYNREYKVYSLEDTDDMNREIFIKRGTKLVVGFTY